MAGNVAQTLAMHLHFNLLLLICLMGYIVSRVSADDGCRSPQHLELGNNGTISCYFSAGFYGVFWYNSTSYESERPFLYYKEGKKTGRGYTSGEFDIHPNGSLVINNVSLEHDHSFTAVHIKRREDDPNNHEVRVVVTVKPKEDRPLIKQCKNSSQKDVCYIQSNGTFDLTCYVEDSRPRIPLMWVKRTLSTEANITFGNFYSSDGIVESSFAKTTYTFNNSECLILLACKTVEDTTMFTTQESLVLAECPHASYFSDTSQIRYVEVYSSVLLTCTHTINLLVVWKRHQENGEYKLVDFTVNAAGDNASNTNISYHTLSHGNFLLIENVSYEVDGLYSCAFGNGSNWGISFFNVIVHAQRSSVILKIKGCEVSEKCEIEAHEEGSLTCKILGVHPRVQLAWVIMTEDQSEGISLFNENVSITQQTEVYDISLTVRYVIKDIQRKRITVKCTLSGPHAQIFSLERAADLVVSQAEVSTKETLSTKAVSDHLGESIFIPALVLFVFIVAVIGLAVFCLRRKASRQDQTGSTHLEEEVRMLPPNRNNEDLIEKMKTDLRGKYRSQYTNISPSLNHLEATYSVETIFVKCPIELLRPPKVSCDTWDTWEKLDSYNDIFREDKFKSKRCFIKAYPCYGKTTLALKLAYDWSEKEEDSFIKDEDLFILLYMKELALFPNIYQAIRQTLLPSDSLLNENDIKSILHRCNSLTIYLDDFEEYSDKSKFSSSDVLSIIKGEMFQNHKVIVTTRSFKFINDHDIKGDRVRLIGFDHSARRAYVDQVFQNESSDDSEILKQLKKNPALYDLCEIPLLFAAFAHMPREYEQFQALDSITKVVSYLVECFEKHALQRYSKTKHVPNLAMDSNEYHKLDEIAFESLARENNKVWAKSDLCRRIGKTLYKKCIKTGILIQDESLLIADYPDNRGQKNYTYKTMVRFHHKVLCERHAAYYVVKKIKHSRTAAVLIKTLNKLDPFKCQLIYLFACGFYPEGTSQITEFLKELPETNTLILLCIYEQTGGVGDIKESLAKMCKDPVRFNNKGSSLKQNTTLKLLDICSVNKINIPAVWCFNCVEHDKCSGDFLVLESGAAIPVLLTLQELMLNSEGVKIDNTNVASIFKYAAKCSNLVKLKIFGHLMPLTFTEDDNFVKFKERDVKVTWIPITEQEYTLDLGSCKWQDTKGESLEQDRYQELEVEFRKCWNLDNEAD